MVNEADGSLVPASMYDKATYNLHPSFGEKAKQGESSSLQWPNGRANLVEPTQKEKQQYGREQGQDLV